MNIAIYVDYFLPASETFIFDQIEILSQRHNVTVICKELDSSGKTPIHVNAYNILPKRFSYRIYKYLFRKQWYKLSSIWISFFLAKFIRSKHFDLVICHFLTNTLDFKHVTLKRPLMVIVHGYDGSQFLKSKKSQEAVSTLIDKEKMEFYFVSQNLKRIAQSYCSNLDGKTIFLGTKLWSRNFTFPDLQNEIHICQISRLVPKKGVDIAIKAIKMLLENNDLSCEVKFTIIGSGPYEEILKESSRPYLDKNIFFIGEVPHEHALKILETTQIYLQPSIVAQDGDSEGLSISLLEAIAMDRWIISTLNSGVSEILHPGDNVENIFICGPNPQEISTILKENMVRFLSRPSITVLKSKLSNQNQIQIIQSYGNL